LDQILREEADKDSGRNKEIKALIEKM